MKIKRDKLSELMNQNFAGNYNKCARALEIDPSHLHRYINDGISGGTKIIGAVYKYCRDNKLDFDTFVEL